MSYADLHVHLLPGLDDGAPTVEEAIAYARRLDARGVRDVACTPHVKRADFPAVDVRSLAAARIRVQDAIAAAGLDVRLHPGAELAHPDALELSPEELALIAQGPSAAPWMLLECPFEGIGPAFLEAVRRLSGLGYGLLLAHPERADGVVGRGRVAVLEPLLADGALLQVNVSSLLGDHGRRAREGARALIDAGLAFCLASDAHPGSRERLVCDAHAQLLRQGISGERAARLTKGNPQFLLRHGAPWARVSARRALAA